MKKSLLLCGAILLSSMMSNAIEFKSAISSDPLLIKLVKIDDCSNGACYLDDRNEKTRLRVFTRQAQYQIVSSSGREFPRQDVSIEDYSKLLTHVKMTSESCPVTIKMDRNTYQIISVEQKCDPLALADQDPQAT